jgi:hypothetical protein
MTHEEEQAQRPTSAGHYPYIVTYAAREAVTRTDTTDVGHIVTVGEIITLRSGVTMTVEEIEDHPSFGRTGHIHARPRAPQRRL